MKRVPIIFHFYLVADATAKVPSGIMLGALKWLGSFDQCMNVAADLTNTSFNGRYCMVDIGTNKRNVSWMKHF